MLNSAWARNALIMEPWNEFDAAYDASGLGPGESRAGTPDRAALLYAATYQRCCRVGLV